MLIVLLILIVLHICVGYIANRMKTKIDEVFKGEIDRKKEINVIKHVETDHYITSLPHIEIILHNVNNCLGSLVPYIYGIVTFMKS